MKSMRQTSKLEQIPCKSKFSSEPKISEAKKGNKSWFYFEYSLKVSQFKTCFNLYSLNSISTAEVPTFFCRYTMQLSRRIHKSNNTLLKERVFVYKQPIHHLQYQMLKVGYHIQNCEEGKFKIFLFFQVNWYSKVLREAWSLYQKNPAIFLIQAHSITQDYVIFVFETLRHILYYLDK